MGTKTKPGAFDCYANAEPDEPMFVLLARDAGAPALIETWARDRLLQIQYGHREPADIAKCIEALDCAKNMRAWRDEKRPAVKAT